jgi:hypothetical protein
MNFLKNVLIVCIAFTCNVSLGQTTALTATNGILNISKLGVGILVPRARIDVGHLAARSWVLLWPVYLKVMGQEVERS